MFWKLPHGAAPRPAGGRASHSRGVPPTPTSQFHSKPYLWLRMETFDPRLQDYLVSPVVGARVPDPQILARPVLGAAPSGLRSLSLLCSADQILVVSTSPRGSVSLPVSSTGRSSLRPNRQTVRCAELNLLTNIFTISCPLTKIHRHTAPRRQIRGNKRY